MNKKMILNGQSIELSGVSGGSGGLTQEQADERYLKLTGGTVVGETTIKDGMGEQIVISGMDGTGMIDIYTNGGEYGGARIQMACQHPDSGQEARVYRMKPSINFRIFNGDGTNNSLIMRGDGVSFNFPTPTKDSHLVPKSYVDAANSYSVEPIQIGTWIDGKPLYRKVLQTTIYPGMGATQNQITSDPLLMYQHVYGFAAANDGKIYTLPYTRLDDTPMTMFSMGLTWESYGGIINLDVWCQAPLQLDVTLVVEYTSRADS